MKLDLIPVGCNTVQGFIDYYNREWIAYNHSLRNYNRLPRWRKVFSTKGWELHDISSLLDVLDRRIMKMELQELYNSEPTRTT